MSYARFGWDNSDVYIILNCNGYLDCCGCRFVPWGADHDIPPSHFKTTEAMLSHLDAHRAAGDCVPDETYDDLRADAAKNDAWMADPESEYA